MGDLGDLLVALHGGPRFRTLRGTVRSWNHAARSMEAFERANRPAGAGSSIAFYGDPVEEPAPATSETFERIWLELPDRARSESEHVHGSRTSRSTVVIRGDTWWSIQDDEVATNGGDPSHSHGLGTSVHLVDPAPWTLAASILVPRGESTVAGRRCLHAELRPRQPSLLDDRPSAPWDPGAGHEIDVDRERGVVLRRTRLLDGEPYAIEGFTEIAFDEALDAALFSFEPPPGVEVHVTTTRPMAPVPLHEVVREAGFTVLAARTVPGGWELDCHHVAESRHGPEVVFLHYCTEAATARVTVAQRAATEPERTPDGAPWQSFDGYSTWEPSGDDWPMPRQVAFEREGTVVQLTSAELGIEALVAFARTFAPASADPPRPV